MRILTPPYWTSFNTENQKKYNGFCFEDLIEVLLDIEFGNNQWKKTRPIKDGGKDFVCRPLPNHWAECKMHDNRIQLTVISKTLVMAINENIKRVLFFSYSKLTQGTRRELSRFSCAADMVIQIFDDDLLEELILKNIKDRRLRIFFPGLTKIDYPKISAHHVFKQFFSKNVEISANQLLTEEKGLTQRSNRVDVNQPCLFELTVDAQSTKKTNIQLDVSELLREDKFVLINEAKLHINNNIIKRCLFPGEVCAFRFYFTPMVVGSQIFPSIPITIGCCNYRTTPIKIEVTRSVRPVLIGQRVQDYLDEFKKCISSSNFVQASVVFGNSGVGKSRFIEECTSKLLAEDYRICLLDGKSSRCHDVNKFVIELLVQLWRIPNPDIFDDADTFEAVLEPCDRIEEKMHKVIRRGLNTILFQEADLADVCLLLEKIITSKRVAILLDNVQSLDALSLLLVGKIFDLIGRIGQGQFVFSFNNEELIYSQKASSLFVKFAEQRANRHIHLYRLEEFSKNDVKMFVDTHLGGISASRRFSQQYPLLFEKICEHIHPSPLDLYLFFKYLWDDGIAVLDNGIFFINDFQRFNTALISLTPELRDILTYRFHKLEQKEEVLRIFLFLSFVGDVAPQEICQLLHVDYEIIDELINGCWLRLDNLGRIDFYHPKIACFLLDKNDFLIAKQGYEVARYLKQEGYDVRYPILDFALAAPIDKQALLDAALQQIKRITIADARNQMLARKLYSYIIQQSLSELSPSLYLEYIHHICLLVAREDPKIIIDCFAKLNDILVNYKPYQSEINIVFQLIRQQASYLCAIDPLQSIHILKNGLLRLNDFGAEYDAYKQFIEMQFNNRLSYCYRMLSNRTQAEKFGLEALYVAEALGDETYVCICNIDLGYIYYGDIKDKDNLIRYWKRAVECYRKNEVYMLNHEYHLAFSCMLLESYIVALEERDYAKATDLLDTVIQLAREKIGCIHHEILGLKAKAIWSIRQNTKLGNVVMLLDSMIDRCLISSDDKNLIKAYHLKAIALDYMKEKELSQSHFLYALTLLSKKKYCSISDKALLWDAAAFYNKQGIRSSSLVKSSFDLTLWKKNGIDYFENQNWEMCLFMLFKDQQYNYPV